MCVQVLAYTDPTESRVSFVTRERLANWGVSVEDALTVAGQNMDRLLAETTVAVEKLRKHRLGLLETHSVFKAALITAPNFRKFIEPSLGWPVFALIPCRDFAYILPERDKKLLSDLGGVVTKEFQNSGYSISVEVFSVSDEGIVAIGSYAPPDDAT